MKKTIVKVECHMNESGAVVPKSICCEIHSTVGLLPTTRNTRRII